MAIQNYKATIQYLGTRYRGWQMQREGETIQGVLSRALSQLADVEVQPVGAGRTDAGVHAEGQVAHFSFPERESVPDLQKALNALLPWDIRVARLTPVAASFHSRKDAKKKRYEYRIYNTDVLPPFLYQQWAHLPRTLNLERMALAAEILLGEHDFTSFTATATEVEDKRRNVFASSVSREGDRIIYRIEGSGFLRHMVRNIVGTLLEVGWSKREPEDIPALLEKRDRRLAGPTASSEGLYLVRIWY